MGQQIELGSSHDALWRKYDGSLDDFRIYNRVLTGAEIAAIHAQDNVLVPSVAPRSSGGWPEKKTRLWESSVADYTALAAAIAETVPWTQRRTNVCDIPDLPDVINYIAVTRITEEDDIWANMSIYRDSDDDQLWRIIPFDLNLSCGQLFGQPKHHWPSG